MYRCAPPTPSSLCGIPSMRPGTNPMTSVPVVSVRYFPTVPLELASPWGNMALRELRRIRADSQALAASTTTRARTCSSRPVSLSMNTTPVASPRRSWVTSRTIALVRSVRLPDCRVGKISTLGDVKFALTVHPRLHCPQ